MWSIIIHQTIKLTEVVKVIYNVIDDITNMKVWLICEHMKNKYTILSILYYL